MCQIISLNLCSYDLDWVNKVCPPTILSITKFSESNSFSYRKDFSKIAIALEQFLGLNLRSR